MFNYLVDLTFVQVSPEFTFVSQITLNTNTIIGCMDASAYNYNSEALVSDGACEDFMYGCTDGDACNYDDEANTEDGSCYIITASIDIQLGQLLTVTTDAANPTYVWFLNDVEQAETSNEFTPYIDAEYAVVVTDGTAGCSVEAVYNLENLGIDENEIAGCQDDTACNYDVTATDDSGNCEYAEQGYDCSGVCLSDIDSDGVCDVNEVVGCQDDTACNYDVTATDDSGNCEYAEQGYDCSVQVGDLVEGGIVFYVDETGEHGLVAALEDITEGSNMGLWGTPEGFEWGCYGSTVSGADGPSIGTGYQNTLDIVAQNCQTQNGGITAAQATLNYESEGYTDWHLPSKDELIEMYNTIGNGSPEGNIGGFENNWYWSSSEYSSYDAWYVSFNNGNSFIYGKGDAGRVRVIRAF
jgi:hypothetical protein